MAVFKCKMCGGDLEIAEGTTVAECEYCGTKQTIPTLKDDNLRSLFNRANTLRRKSEFDKAEQLYEKILQSDETQPEAYWGLILCRYGIEYVEDPTSFKRVPTCHRASFDSIVADEDYKQALKYADAQSRAIYEAEAKEIDRIQKEIIELSAKESPYDVFICYKETDENGQRTQDSVIANDIYYQLTQEGFKVFYAAITLEDKLGSAYEPCIFAALNSARVMLSIGTCPEHFNAVWVKNEWSRYLKIMKKDRSRILIPCYKNMDAYELPEEFSHLQAQDMGKIGFINDVVRGIKKVVQKEDKPIANTAQTVVTASNTNTAPLLKRAFMFLEDADWNSANEYCEKVLDVDPECADAYLGKLMAHLQVRTKEGLKECKTSFEQEANYQKVMRFASDELKQELAGYIAYINDRNEKERIEGIYNSAKEIVHNPNSDENQLLIAARQFESIKEYKDSEVLAKVCLEKAETCRKEKIYNAALTTMKAASDEQNYIHAAKQFDTIKEYKNSALYAKECREKAEEARLNKIRLEEEKQKRAKKTKRIAIAVITVIVSIVFVATSFNFNAWRNIEQVAAGRRHIIALKSNGAVVAIGDNNSSQCDVADWTNIESICAGAIHTVGLKSGGTVVATGANNHGQCDVGNWRDIVDISVGNSYTVGLKSDGTVVATGSNRYGQCNVDEWTDIIAISAGANFTVGLKSDGTAVAVGNNYFGKCDVTDWRDIDAISTGDAHTLGLKSDGTVVATGSNISGQCDVDDWENIIAIGTGNYHTVGLKSDGTVIATGSNDYGQCDVDDWKDIVAVSADYENTIGIKSNGTVVVAGQNAEEFQRATKVWKGFFGIG